MSRVVVARRKFEVQHSEAPFPEGQVWAPDDVLDLLESFPLVRSLRQLSELSCPCWASVHDLLFLRCALHSSGEVFLEDHLSSRRLIRIQTRQNDWRMPPEASLSESPSDPAQHRAQKKDQ